MKVKTNITSGQMKNHLELCEGSDMVPERYQKLIRSGIMSDILHCPDPEKVDRVALQKILGVRLPASVVLTINYRLSLIEMARVSQCDLHNEITNENFMVVRPGAVAEMEFEARLFHFNISISSREAVRRIEMSDSKNPWSPARIEHMIAYGKTLGEDSECKMCKIIGLGSSCRLNRNRHVPVFFLDSSRFLDLVCPFGGLDKETRFLAVRERVVS